MRHDLDAATVNLFEPKRALDLHGSSISLREKVVAQDKRRITVDRHAFRLAATLNAPSGRGEAEVGLRSGPACDGRLSRGQPCDRHAER